MLTTRSEFSWYLKARTLRSTCVIGALLVGGCALPRRDAPPSLQDETTDTVSTQASKRSRVANQEVERPLRDVPVMAEISNE